MPRSALLAAILALTGCSSEAAAPAPIVVPFAHRATATPCSSDAGQCTDDADCVATNATPPCVCANDDGVPSNTCAPHSTCSTDAQCPSGSYCSPSYLPNLLCDGGSLPPTLEGYHCRSLHEACTTDGDCADAGSSRYCGWSGETNDWQCVADPANCGSL